ncbi:MAG: hypothetical protein LM560_07010 [Desulfurococcaceae archaeon]|jgi:hypothetical protein|nr:hypothetical protein [Desulfurococcaceae archaeon]
MTSVKFKLPPKGFIARRFIEVAVLVLGRGIEIRGDELVITDCMNFSMSLNNVINNVDKGMNIFLTGNDRKYIIGRMARILGLDVSGESMPIHLLQALSKVIEKSVKDVCITKDLQEEISLLNILKVNFYEYGRAYLSKPKDKFLMIDKLPIFLQLLGILGILVSTVGIIKNQGIRYYVLPPEGIPLKLPPGELEEMLKHFNTAYKILKNYYDMPRSILITRLAMELINTGCEDDRIIAELIGIQEGGKRATRATVVSVEPISTEGLIQIIRTSIIDEKNVKELATKLGLLIDVGLQSLREGLVSGDKTGTIVLRLTSDLLMYARTKSLDSLYSAISILERSKEYIKRDPQEFKYLINTLKERGTEPNLWLSELIRLMSMLIRAYEASLH